jgi:PKD domain
VNGRRARLAVIAAASGLAAAAPAQAGLAPPVTIDGPSPAIVSLDGVVLAQDGGGAVVYRKITGGVAHVFAALERAGAWGVPVQVDVGFATGASASAAAVSNGGRVVVVWISGATLYGAVHAAGSSRFSAPQAIAAATGVPALGMSVSGTAYVAYIAPAGSAANVDVARLDRISTSFAVLSGALNAAPVTLASAGGPSIAVAADATAIVAWAQEQAGGAHVFVRRVSGAGPSPVLDDATLGGVASGAADSPQVAITYDSSYAWVAFRETFGAVSRVAVTGVLGDELRPAAFADSLGPAATTSAATAPSLAVNGNGAGLLASELTPGNGLAVSALGTRGAPAGWASGTVVTTTPPTVPPGPLVALSANGNGVVAYAPSAGALDAELFDSGAASGPSALSSAALGPVVTAAGVHAGADDNGDLVVGFVAGAPGTLSVVVQPIVVAPGAPRATGTQQWIADKRPVLRWQTATASSWTPPTYAVYIDERRVATVTGASYTVPGALRDGRHTWKVVAIDPIGQRASSLTRTLLINAARPSVRLHVSGTRQAGTALGFAVAASALSGVRRVTIDYGDGHASRAAGSTHAYTTSGRYTVTVTVTDRAGASAVLHTHVTIP